MAQDAEPARHAPAGSGREALMNAAITIVGQRGLRGLTYRAVAQAAGVTHALVTHHFGSREALISEALASSVRSVEHATFDSGEELQDFAADLPSFIANEEDLLAFQYELTMEARRQPELNPDIQKMYTDVLERIEERLAAFGCPDDVAFARVVLAAIDGMILQQIAFGREDQTAEGVRVLQQLIAERRSSG
jgi:AcrR family transcriptional regulator